MSEEKRDYVKEAYECFIKNAEGLDPTDPVKAVEAYFEKNATDELKARCKAEGKDAKKCWEFITAVARKVGGNCHIDPGAVYAMAMHYFEDVPVDWKGAKGKEKRGKAEVVDKVDKNVDKPKKSKAKKPAAKVKAKKARGSQGFFFELLDAPEKEASKEVRVQYLVWAARHGKSLKEAVKFFAFKRQFTHNMWGVNNAIGRRWQEEHGTYDVPRKDSLKIDWWRLYSMFGKWKITECEYINYLQAAVEAGLDWRNDGTLYPPTKGGREAFMERYERLEAQAATEKRKHARRAKKAERERFKALFAERMPEIEMFQKSLERVKTLKGCGYSLVLAKTQAELLVEGRKMNNCVGNGVYGRGILEGDTLIVMLKSADGKSYCDIEIERYAWKVRQCYTKGNQLPPDEVRKLAKRIAAELKKIYKLSKKRKAA